MSTIPFVTTAKYPLIAEWICALQKALPEETIVSFDELSDEEKSHVTLAIVANPDPENLQKMPRLQWVHSVWAGVERMIADLGNTPLKIVRLVDPQMAATMAESVLAWTLYLHRGMPAYARQQQQRIWREHPYVCPQSRTVSLLGLGTLGSASAQRLLTAGFKVCGWSRAPKTVPGIECFSGDTGLTAMLLKTDTLVCLLPLTPDTRGLLNSEKLALLPRGASLINFARGPIINDDDLRAALDGEHLDHAVLDVFDIEPLPADRWHWTHPRVTVLPHCTAPTDRETASRIVATNIRRYRETGELPACVDVTRGY